MSLQELTKKIIEGYEISRDEAIAIYHAPLEDLKESATAITTHFYHDALELNFKR